MDKTANSESKIAFSLLLSVYRNDHPDHLLAALKSVWDDQTVRPSEIVLVKDGPLNPELDRVIADFCPTVALTILALPVNVGLGSALAEGMKKCSFPLIARMDSDDIACAQRFEYQIREFVKNPALDICGADIAEFEDDPHKIVSRRILPKEQHEIRRFAKIRNPLNHMTVMFKKAAVEAVGGYLPFHGYEDYYLWVRMLQNGAVFHNVEGELVLARVGNNMLTRRHGYWHFRQEIRLQREFVRIGFANRATFTRNILLRGVPRLFPIWGLKMIYKQILR